MNKELINSLFHWSDNDKATKITTAICGGLGICAFIYLLIDFIRMAFDGTKSWHYNGYFVVLLILAAAPIGYFLYHMTLKKEYKYEKLFLVLAICWGLFFQFALPAFSGPDENQHFISAYNASDVILGLDNGEEGTFLMRKGDTCFWDYDVHFPDVYQQTADGDWFHMSDENKELMTVTLTYVDWYRYIPTGIGIAIARLLGFGTVGLIYMGRLFNMLFFILCGYVAIKICPVGKAQICSVAMLPMVIELCNSFSYDTLSISMTLLFACMCLYLGEKDTQFKAIHLVILAMLLAFLLPNKAVYIAYVIMVLSIPLRKWWSMLTRKSIVNAGILIGSVAAAAYVYIKYLHIILMGQIWLITTRWEGHSIEQYEGREAFSWFYMMREPVVTIKLVIHTFLRWGWTDYLNVLGRNPMHHSLLLVVPVWTLIIMTIVMAINLICNRGKGAGKYRFIVWVITSIATLAIIVVGCLVRFTPLDGERVQISARYLTPIFTTGIVMAGSDEKENQWSLKLLFIQNICIIPYIVYVLNYLFTLGQ